MRILNLLLILFFLISSCKRDRLRGDKDILVGKWRWVKTTFDGSACNPPDNPIPMTPAIRGREESVEFLKKGKLFTYINGEKQQEFKLKFDGWGEGDFLESSYFFILNLHIENQSEHELLLSGEVNNDTLILNNFSAESGSSSGGCTARKSYFLRE